MSHIPDNGQVLQRYYGYYANRTRGERRKAAQVAEADAADGEQPGTATTDPELPLAAVPIGEPAEVTGAEARRRWATLIRLIHEVDPLTCPNCGGPMRLMALIQEPKVIDKILGHLRDKGRDARAGPWATGPPTGEAAA